MGVFKQAVITNEGERLLTKIMANATTLKFTHATTSNHEYPEDLNIKELKELEGIRQTTDAPSAQIESENVVGVKALFENAKVEESYYIWNIGLYAESEDGEILFAVCQAQTPDQMPAFKGVAPSAYIYDIRLAISQASSLTIVVNPSGTVTMQDLIELEKKKVSIQGGDISDTVINIENPPDEDKNPVKYPEIGDSGTTKSIMGQIRRWLKSLKEDKVDKKGGDVSDTVVSGLTDSTASFPQPTAGDSQETLWGKVKKWQQDCLIKFGNYVLMSMITNQHLNSTSNIPTSALVYLMQQAIQQNQNAINVLNTKHKVMIKKYTKTIKIPANSFTGSIMLDIQPPSGLKAVGILGIQTDYPATITPTLWYLNKGNQIAFCLYSTYGSELTCTVFFHVLLLPESWDITVNN